MNYKIWENGVVRDMYSDEIATMETEARKADFVERTRPLTAEEVSRMVIAQQVNALEVDDNTALRMKAFYPEFKDIVGQKVKKGFKFTFADKLWRIEQPEMTIQAHYPPGEGMESLYTEVCENHSGTIDDPIPYSGNMALEEGKYYHQDYVIYRCFRDAEIPVHQPLAELVELYVEVV